MSVINGGNPCAGPGQRIQKQLENVICPVCKTRGLARKQKLREAVELNAGTFKSHHLKTLYCWESWSKGTAEPPDKRAGPSKAEKEPLLAEPEMPLV